MFIKSTALIITGFHCPLRSMFKPIFQTLINFNPWLYNVCTLHFYFCQFCFNHLFWFRWPSFHSTQLMYWKSTYAYIIVNSTPSRTLMCFFSSFDLFHSFTFKRIHSVIFKYQITALDYQIIEGQWNKASLVSGIRFYHKPRASPEIGSLAEPG